MQPNYIKSRSITPAALGGNPTRIVPAEGDATVAPPVGEAPCPTCAEGAANSMPPSYVYAIGRIEPRFPRLAVEKEFAQATGRSETAGLTDGEALHKVLTQRSNRYLLQKLCWVLTIEGVETYLLHPRDPADIDLLVEAIRPTSRRTDVDAVIGARGPVAPAGYCNGLAVPIVLFDNVYSFDVDSLVKSIPRPKEFAEKEFAKTGEEILDRILQMADNAGATNEHRALNYLALRYPAIYAKAAECYAEAKSLCCIDVRQSRLSGARNILDVIFSYTSRQTDVTEKYFVRVDVTEEFPFLVTKLSPFYDR